MRLSQLKLIAWSYKKTSINVWIIKAFDCTLNLLTFLFLVEFQNFRIALLLAMLGNEDLKREKLKDMFFLTNRTYVMDFWVEFLQWMSIQRCMKNLSTQCQWISTLIFLIVNTIVIKQNFFYVCISSSTFKSLYHHLQECESTKESKVIWVKRKSWI